MAIARSTFATVSCSPALVLEGDLAEIRHEESALGVSLTSLDETVGVHDAVAKVDLAMAIVEGR